MAPSISTPRHCCLPRRLGKGSRRGAHCARGIISQALTEMAQRVIDRAVQIFGGNGVRVGVKVEALYREIRALRIYEGATEVQKLIVARELLKTHDITRGQAAE